MAGTAGWARMAVAGLGSRGRPACLLVTPLLCLCCVCACLCLACRGACWRVCACSFFSFPGWSAVSDPREARPSQALADRTVRVRK